MVRRGPAGGGRFRGVTPRLLPMLVHPQRLSDRALTGEIMDMAERVGPAAFLRQQAAILGRPDSRADLADIAVPTLIAVGADDVLTPPAHAEEMARLIPGATYRVLHECGHLSPMERPDEVSAMVNEWLVGHV
jgi:pimeloyl-ACP methyl ester carboxylesterase